jgi:hypothetical protein
MNRMQAKHRRPRLNLEAIAKLTELADYSFAFAIRAVGAIGVADHLLNGPRPIDELAHQTHCNQHALLRVMRALVTRSVFAEDPPGTFSLQPIGELLCTDHPLSMRWFFRSEPDVRAMAGLEYSLRTGEPAFNEIFGMDYFDWMAAHPETRERFRESQRALNRLELLTIVRSFSWQEVASIVDVGGNDGALVAALLRRYPRLSGTVFDLPEVVAAADKVFKEADVSERARAVPGNLFDGGVPSGADVYIMKRILVGFSDDQARSALVKIRESMKPDSRLLIMEPMAASQDQIGISLDLRMLVLGVGRVRTAKEFGVLLVDAGLKPRQAQNAGLLTILPAGFADP